MFLEYVSLSKVISWFRSGVTNMSTAIGGSIATVVWVDCMSVHFKGSSQAKEVLAPLV